MKMKRKCSFSLKLKRKRKCYDGKLKENKLKVRIGSSPKKSISFVVCEVGN